MWISLQPDTTTSCSFKPDPGAEAMGALAHRWKCLNLYAFPPFNLLGRCLKNIHQERVQLTVIIAPVWWGQSWYPALLERLVDLLILLPYFQQILVNPSDQVAISSGKENSLKLATWKVSGDSLKVRDFRLGIQNHFFLMGALHGEIILFNQEEMAGLIQFQNL